MEKRWHLIDADDRIVASLTEQLHISRLLATVLVNRGITTMKEGAYFLTEAAEDMHDPYQMNGMERAVTRIDQALADDENIVIYGDYDVDGMTATSLLCNVLEELGGTVSFYIPDRQTEGYGPNQEAFQTLLDQGTGLLITVDCGIAAYDVVHEFQGKMDIIITDHHEPPAQLPPAYVILNPKQHDDTYPYRQLAGAGVAYKLAQALWQYVKHEPLQGYSDIAALGTIADLVPLTGENRLIAKEGLQCMRDGHNLGIQALFDAAGLNPEEITAGRISYTIAPRLNAAGRISHASQGVELLRSTVKDKAQTLAVMLSALNEERQQIEVSIAQEAIKKIKERHEEQDGVLVAVGAGWHVGVIGIAASRLVETYYRPSLVIGIHDGVGKGSCRSIAGFNIYEALTYASDLLLQFGGHPMAAGFSIAADKIDALRERLNEYAAQHMTAADYIPVEAIDMTLTGQDISLQQIAEISCLEPYGMGNSRPVFSLEKAKITEIRPIGKEKQHLRLAVTTPDGASLSAIGWSMADRAETLVEGDCVDLAFQLERNDFNGLSSPQLVLQDIHQPIPQIHLDRTTMIDIYITLKQWLSARSVPAWQGRQRLLAALGDRYDGHTLLAALQVLIELGVVNRLGEPGDAVLYMPVLTQKMCLDTSPTYQHYSQR